MRRFLLFFLIAFASVCSFAQNTEYTMIHQGNRAFLRGQWAQAEQYYRKALEANPRSSRAMFNLGDAFLSQKNTKDALDWYTKAAKAETNRNVKAMAYHNIGFVHHTNREYDKAIDAYKEALRLNPHDEDTRYNLALCQKQKNDKLKQDKQQQQQKQDEPKPQNNQDKQQQQKQQQQQQQMQQDNIDQLLQLAKQTEQMTRQKIEQAKKPRRKQLDKNW